MVLTLFQSRVNINYYLLILKMSKKINLLASTVTTALLAFVAPLSAFAIKVQDELTYDFETTTSSGEEMSGIGAILFFAFSCFIVVLSFATLVIWVLSIIDIVKRENWKSENDKMIWLLLVVFVNFVGLYYYFFYRKSLDRAGTQGKVEAPVTPKVE